MMKAKLVNENINFERNIDKLSSLKIGKEGLFNQLSKEYRFVLTYRDEKDNEKAKENYIKNIFEIKKFIDLFNKLNIKIKNIFGLFGISFEIEAFYIIESSRVILECFTKKDAEYLINEIIKTCVRINSKNLTIDIGDSRCDLNEENLQKLMNLIK